MPTRSLQFDGPDLEAVLEEALAEAGPGSRIVAADRVRKGGIGGFFAREHFEVTVEVDDEGGRRPSAGRDTGSPRGLRGLRGASATRGTAAVARPAEPGASATPSEGHGRDRASDALSPAGDAAPPRSFTELADDTEDVVELSGGPAAGTPSPAGTPSAGVATSVEAAIAGRRTSRPPSGPATAPARSAGQSGPGAGAPEDAVPSTARPSFASLLAGIARDTAFPAGTNVLTGAERTATWTGRTSGPVRPHAADAAAPQVEPASSAARRRAADAFADAAALGASGTSPATARDEQAGGDAAPASNLPASPATAGTAPPPDGQTALALAAVGLPGSLLPAPDVLGCLDTLTGTEDAAAYLQLALARSLHGLPAVPAVPTGSGRLLVVAGELDRAWEVARRLAVEAGADAADVRVAAPKRPRRRVERRLLVTGVDDAEMLMSERRRTKAVTVVALDAPVSARPDPFCHDLLDALVPTAVWGVASATHKGEDVAAWAEALGGLDALAVVDAASSTSPGTLLELGIPVASLDGRAATPALWAAVLVGQLLLAQGAPRALDAIGG